jgi:hypothetical protein
VLRSGGGKPVAIPINVPTVRIFGAPLGWQKYLIFKIKYVTISASPLQHTKKEPTNIASQYHI